MTGNYLRRHGYLLGAEATANHREDISVLALSAGPGLIILVRDGLKANGNSQFRSLEKQFLHHLAGGILIYPDQDAQGQRTVDIGLADVQDLRIITGQDAHNGRGEPHLVLSGNAN